MDILAMAAGLVLFGWSMWKCGRSWQDSIDAVKVFNAQQKSHAEGRREGWLEGYDVGWEQLRRLYQAYYERFGKLPVVEPYATMRGGEKRDLVADLEKSMGVPPGSLAAAAGFVEGAKAKAGGEKRVEPTAEDLDRLRRMHIRWE